MITHHTVPRLATTLYATPSSSPTTNQQHGQLTTVAGAASVSIDTLSTTTAFVGLSVTAATAAAAAVVQSKANARLHQKKTKKKLGSIIAHLNT